MGSKLLLEFSVTFRNQQEFPPIAIHTQLRATCPNVLKRFEDDFGREGLEFKSARLLGLGFRV